MSLCRTLNDNSVAMDTRVSLAWGSVLEPSDSSTENQSAAKCWLVYRMIDRIVEPDQFAYLSGLPVGYPGSAGLSVRWRMSQTMAEIYYHGLVSDDAAELDHKILDALTTWRTSGHLWPPCVLGFVRAAGIRYARCRSGHAEAVAAIEDWQSAVYMLDWTSWPLRLVEMRDDLDAVWRILSMLKGHADYNYTPFSWLPRFAGGHPYHRLMAKLGAPDGFDTSSKP